MLSSLLIASIILRKDAWLGSTLAVQWLRLCHASTAEDEGSIPGQGIKISQAVLLGQNVGEKRKKEAVCQLSVSNKQDF